MTEANVAEDPLRDWDPRRRAALRRLWDQFAAGDTTSNLSDELVAERRREAAAEDSQSTDR